MYLNFQILREKSRRQNCSCIYSVCMHVYSKTDINHDNNILNICDENKQKITFYLNNFVVVESRYFKAQSSTYLKYGNMNNCYRWDLTYLYQCRTHNPTGGKVHETINVATRQFILSVLYLSKNYLILTLWHNSPWRGLTAL